MKRMLWLGIGGATGYVMGSRAGRESYDRLVRLARDVSGRVGQHDDDLGPGTASSVGAWTPSTEVPLE